VLTPSSLTATVTAGAAGYLSSRWLTYANRWELLPFEFNDMFLTAAQLGAVGATLALFGQRSFSDFVISIALADLGMAVAVLVDRLITAATVWPAAATSRRR
jgi:hypothetical protein